MLYLIKIFQKIRNKYFTFLNTIKININKQSTKVLKILENNIKMILITMHIMYIISKIM